MYIVSTYRVIQHMYIVSTYRVIQHGSKFGRLIQRYRYDFYLIPHIFFCILKFRNVLESTSGGIVDIV
jgi:hypothetical protein